MQPDAMPSCIWLGGGVDMLDDLNQHVLFFICPSERLNNSYVVIHFSTFDTFLEHISFNPDLKDKSGIFNIEPPFWFV